MCLFWTSARKSPTSAQEGSVGVFSGGRGWHLVTDGEINAWRNVASYKAGCAKCLLCLETQQIVWKFFCIKVLLHHYPGDD